MSRHQNSQYDERASSFYATPTTFPDILSAPAPVLRDQDILIDGETVAHLPEFSSSSPTFASPPQQYQKPPRRQQQTTSPTYAAARPSPVHTQPAAPVPPAYSYHRRDPSPTTVTSDAVSSLTTSPTVASPPHVSQPSPSFVNHPDNQFGFGRSSSYNPQHEPPSVSYDPYSGGSGTSDGSPRYYSSTSGGTILHETQDSRGMIPIRPPEVARMRQRRKVATVAAGVAGGVAGLAILGPLGALAGGVGGAMMTKTAGKRLERKQTERIAAQRHAAEEQRYGTTVPALKAESGLL